VGEQAPPLEQDALVRQDIQSELKTFSEPIKSSQLLADLEDGMSRLGLLGMVEKGGPFARNTNGSLSP